MMEWEIRGKMVIPYWPSNLNPVDENEVFTIIAPDFLLVNTFSHHIFPVRRNIFDAMGNQGKMVNTVLALEFKPVSGCK